MRLRCPFEVSGTQILGPQLVALEEELGGVALLGGGVTRVNFGVLSASCFER